MTERDLPCILFVGFGATPTGFSRVLTSILENLPNRYRLHHFAINIDWQVVTHPWITHSNLLPGDVSGVVQLGQLIEELHPAIVLLLHDLSDYGLYSSVLEQYKNGLQIVHYCAIDSSTCYPGEIESLSGINELVVFTDFGKRVLEAGEDLVRGGQPSFNLPPIQVIPHGVDTDLFRPLCGGNDAAGFAASRREARRVLFPHDRALQDAFIVLNANQNNWRKRIDLTLEGFARFARNKPDNVKLYLHMARKGYGYDVRSLAESMGIEGRLILSADESEHPSASSEELNLIYNSCDVGLNTCMREGWGLISFEHAATGAAQIVPKHSACEEVWQGSALLLEPVDRFTDMDMRENVPVSAEGVAHALEQLYGDRNLLDEMAVRAYKNATKPEYAWKNVARHWDSLFQRMISGTG